MRQLAALTVALLLVTAGCNAFPGGDAGTTTSDANVTTPGDGTAETTAEPTAEATESDTETTAWDAETTSSDADLPPGLSASGVTDPWKLADAHRAALNDTSYAARTNMTAAAENGTVLARSNSTLRVAAGGLPQVNRYEAGGERPAVVGSFGRDVEAWVDENRTLYAMEGPNGTTYQRASADARPPLRPEGRDHLYLLFAGFETAVTGTETRDGTAHYRVNSTGVKDAEILADALRTETVDEASLSALVTEDGLVREYRVEYAGAVENDTVQVERTTRFTGLGETAVERPPWYDEAVNATES